jgi:hypothetical protein
VKDAVGDKNAGVGVDVEGNEDVGVWEDVIDDDVG